MMKTAFLFPGQGAQSAGMGADIAGAFAECNELYDRANDLLGYDLKSICFHGPEKQLNSTTVSQPAIFVTSAAILSVMKSGSVLPPIKADVAAGLSLGEYTALYAAGALEFDEALLLVQERGRAMQGAADASDGGMVSILGLELDQVQSLCDEASQGGILQPTNFNCPGQIVISGESDACDRATSLAEKYGAMKAVKLKVAGAFHTEMMAPAAEALRKVLEQSRIVAPRDVKVIANVDALYYDDAAMIRSGLVRQLIEPIFWQACMAKLLAEGVETFYEIGPGRVLTGLMKRIRRKTTIVNVSNLAAIEQLQAQPVGTE